MMRAGKRVLGLGWVVLLGGLCAGCATGPGGARYGQAPWAGEVIEGVVVDLKPAVIQGPGTGLGGFIGGSAGMMGGSQIGEGSGARAAGAFGGLVLGTILGTAVEKEAARKPGWEVWIETGDGRTFVYPVGNRHPFYRKGRVALVMGPRGELVQVKPL